MLKFKTEAELARWLGSLPEKQRTFVTASCGGKMLATPTEVVARAPCRRTTTRPVRADVRRAAAWAFLALTWVGLWGASLCLATLWGLSHGCDLL